MTIVVSCSIQEEWCSFTQERLKKMGVQSPVAAPRSGLTPLELTRRMRQVAGLSDEAVGLVSPHQLGKAWQIAAADLIIANSENDFWGWSDKLNISLLDFWKDFEPNSRFLLIYGSPADFVASTSRNTNGLTESIEPSLKHWEDYHTEMLNFYQQNSDVSMLVNIHNFEGTARNLNALFKDRLRLTSPRLNKAENLSTSSLLTVIAERFLYESSSQLELYSELENSADLSAQESNHTPRHLSEKAVIEFAGNRETLESKRIEFEEMQSKLEALDRELIEKDTIIASSRQDTQTQESESSVLLKRQLDQTRDELHYYYRKYQELKLAGPADTRESYAPHRTDIGADNANADGTTTIDLRSYVNGTGWHHAEEIGRWAGASLSSTVKIPALEKGKYRLTVRVVDAMAVDILYGTTLTFNGAPLKGAVTILSEMGGRLAPLRRLKARLNSIEKPFPATVSAIIQPAFVHSDKGNLVSIESPRAIRPESLGEVDDRELSSCIQSVMVQRLD